MLFNNCHATGRGSSVSTLITVRLIYGNRLLFRRRVHAASVTPDFRLNDVKIETRTLRDTRRATCRKRLGNTRDRQKPGSWDLEFDRAARDRFGRPSLLRPNLKTFDLFFFLVCQPLCNSCLLNQLRKQLPNPLRK